MTDFVIKCFLHERHGSDVKGGPKDSYHNIMQIRSADYVNCISNDNGHTVTGKMNDGSVSFRETVPHNMIPQGKLEYYEPRPWMIIIENRHGKTSQSFKSIENIPIMMPDGDLIMPE